MIEKYAIRVTNKEDYATKVLWGEPFTPLAKEKRELQEQIMYLMKLKDNYLDRYMKKRTALVDKLYDVQS